MKKKNGVNQVSGPNNPPTVSITQEQTHLYQGPIPPPDVLQKFDALVPGTAEQLIKLAIDESLHRRDLEQRTLNHNIEIHGKRLSSTTATERMSQMLGFFVVGACIGCAFYLAKTSPIVASFFIGIPMASVVKAFIKK